MLPADLRLQPRDLRPLFPFAPRISTLAGDVGGLLSELPSEQERGRRDASVRRAVFERSADIRAPQFDRISTDDLIRLFDLYDAGSFRALLSRLPLRSEPRRPVFRLSRRMTKSAGATRRRLHPPDECFAEGRAEFEISISTLLLWECFRTGSEPVYACGIACHDRLAVLQRVFEHELVHLFEWQATGTSSCRAAPFKALAAALFGHTESTHSIRRTTPTPPGTHVRFTHKGVVREGIVNRITRRATVLVPHPCGEPYADGNRYQKFYVPVHLLERIQPTPTPAPPPLEHPRPAAPAPPTRARAPRPAPVPRGLLEPEPVPTPLPNVHGTRRAPPNAPCPCGSRRKFKKCCA